MSLTKSKRGKFFISDKYFFNEDLSDLLEVFSQLKFIPTKVEHLFIDNVFEMVGISPLFEDVDYRLQAPVYDVIITVSPTAPFERPKFTVTVSLKDQNSIKPQISH